MSFEDRVHRIWENSDSVSTINPDTGRHGWHGLALHQAWPTMNLDPRSPGFTLKMTVDPPPPKPPISIITIFGEPSSSPLYPITVTAAKRMCSHFGYFHVDVDDHFLSLAKDIEEDPMRAYLAGKLGWLSPAALLQHFKAGRIEQIPGMHLVEIVHKRIDELVAQGHRRFIMTGFPDTVDHFPRFLTDVSDVKCAVWFLVVGNDVSQDRDMALNHFHHRQRAICVQIGGRSCDQVYTELMAKLYERTLSDGTCKVEEGHGLVEESGGETAEGKGGR